MVIFSYASIELDFFVPWLYWCQIRKQFNNGTFLSLLSCYHKQKEWWLKLQKRETQVVLNLNKPFKFDMKWRKVIHSGKGNTLAVWGLNIAPVNRWFQIFPSLRLMFVCTWRCVEAAHVTFVMCVCISDLWSHVQLCFPRVCGMGDLRWWTICSVRCDHGHCGVGGSHTVVYWCSERER